MKSLVSGPPAPDLRTPAAGNNKSPGIARGGYATVDRCLYHSCEMFTMFFGPKGLKPAQITALREEVGELLTVVFDQWVREWGKDLGIPSPKLLKPLVAQIDGRIERFDPSLLHMDRSNALALIRQNCLQLEDRQFTNTCGQIDPSFIAADTHLRQRRISMACDELSNAEITARQLFGEGHALPGFVAAYTAALRIPPEQKLESARPVSSERTKPSAEMRRDGFTVFTVLPREIGDRLELRKFLLSTVQKAEKRWAERSGPDGAYGNGTSACSTFGTATARGPRVYAPDGSYRGRVTAGLGDADTIMSSASRFGDQKNPDSMFYHLFGAGRGQCPASWRSDQWTIVADQR